MSSATAAGVVPAVALGVCSAVAVGDGVPVGDGAGVGVRVGSGVAVAVGAGVEVLVAVGSAFASVWECQQEPGALPVVPQLPARALQTERRGPLAY